MPVSDPRVWGATAQECAARYPCDELGFASDDTYFRAVEIRAAPALVWRWVHQLRVAPYSYDWLDNFGRRSPPQRSPGLAPPVAGDRVMTIFRVAGVTERDLTIRLASAPGRLLMGDFAGTYRVSPVPAGAQDAPSARLIAKVLVRYPGGVYGALLRRAMPYLDLVMFRKQLLTLKDYAEREAASGVQSDERANALLR